MKEPSRVDVWKMFDQISLTYDRVNQWMTLGLHQQWRKALCRHLPPSPHLHVLDIATGTGDQIIALVEGCVGIEKVYGIDLSLEMLALAEAKIQKKPYREIVSLLKGNALELPFDENSFDVVTISFGIRNVTDVVGALKEAVRVLKPYGKLLILEGSIPKNRCLQLGHRLYLRYLLPWLGAFLARHRHAYRYLNQTIETFPSGEEFVALLRTAGLSSPQSHPLMGGVVSIYTGEKNVL